MDTSMIILVVLITIVVILLVTSEYKIKVIEDELFAGFCDATEPIVITGTETIKVQYHDPELLPIQKTGGAKSDWIDLRAAEDVEMKAGDYKLISLGVSIQLPEGYEAIVAPRSSTFRHYGVIMSNSIGVIDESYCSSFDVWHFPAYATEDTLIHKNERICQFRIIRHQPNIYIEEVDELTSEARGGLGSSGRI